MTTYKWNSLKDLAKHFREEAMRISERSITAPYSERPFLQTRADVYHNAAYIVENSEIVENVK